MCLYLIKEEGTGLDTLFMCKSHSQKQVSGETVTGPGALGVGPATPTVSCRARRLPASWSGSAR